MPRNFAAKKKRRKGKPWQKSKDPRPTGRREPRHRRGRADIGRASRHNDIDTGERVDEDPDDELGRLPASIRDSISSMSLDDKQGGLAAKMRGDE